MSVKMSKLSIFKNFNYNLIGLVTSNISFAIGIGLISRKFGPESFGEVNSFIASIAIFLPLILYGASNFYTREYAKSKSEKEIINYFNYTVPMFLALTLGLIVLYLIFDFYEISFFIQAIYILLIILSQALDIQWIYRIEESTKMIAISMSLSSVFNLLLFIIFFKFLTPEFYLITTVLTKLMISCLLFLLDSTKRKYFFFFFSFFKNLRLQKQNRKNNITIFILSLSGVLNLIYIKSDIVMLNMYDLKIQAGYYAGAYTVINFILLFRSTLLSVLMPTLINAYNKGESVYLERLSLYIKMGVILGSVIIGSVFFVNTIIIKVLLGEQYLAASNVLNILLIMVLILFLNMGISASLIALGKDKNFVTATLLAALVNIIGNAIFIPYYGMYAAAGTTLISEIIVLVYALAILDKGSSISYIKLFFRNTFGPFLLGMGIYLLNIFIGKFFLPESSHDIYKVAKTVIFISLYCIALVKFKFIENSDLKILLKVNI